MHTLTAKDADTKSLDLVAENIEQLKPDIPEAFTEGNIDFEVLIQLLGGDVAESEENMASIGTASERHANLHLLPLSHASPLPEDSVTGTVPRTS